ncbi:MAG TPA: MFS transporter [Longimicrobiales bacterium]|nr:MFS transporter [Longimicrobiales bacterium]
MTNPAEPVADTGARALLRERDYMVYLVTRAFGVLGTVAQSVTMGWQVYDLARAENGVAESALWVGLLGLATFIPLFFLALPAGVVADRYSRRHLLMACFAAEAVCAAGLVGAAVAGILTVNVLIAIALGFGVARAFRAPAGVALAPMLVPTPLLPRAIAWNALAFQIGTISGPALAGLVVAHWSSAHSYAVSLVLYAVPIVGLNFVRRSTTPRPQAGSRVERVKEGLRYIRNNRLVLGAITLDLFAVLLGGATALLPVFARDILHVGPQGFGLLRSAPAVGAAVVALVLASRPVHRRAGFSLFMGVAVFGMATIVFGLSKSFWLSLGALATLGGADMVSVYVRQTLVQIVTPDAMRGRVASVSFLFIGASNELGEFESGVTARIFGPVLAAVLGGVASLAVTGLWARYFPSLRRVDRLE